MADYYEILSWSSNFLSFLLFIYILIKTFNSSCFNVFDTALLLINLGLSVYAQFMSVVIKNKLSGD